MKNFFSRRSTGRGLSAVTALTALGAIASSAFAQVEYVRAISVPGETIGILPIVQAPYVTGMPGVTNELQPISTTTGEYYTISPTTGLYSTAAYPAIIKVNPASRLSWIGQSSAESGPTIVFVTALTQILTYDVRTRMVTSSPLISVDYDVDSSVAARSLDDPVSIILDSQHYTVDLTTGVGTPEPLAGVDTATTQFMAYGADGLLYVLDYAHNRIASFDPDNAFAPVGGFSLETGVTTANEQFAIGINGDFYLGDGLGGGSDYNSQGAFLGVFDLPEGAATGAYRGQSYLTTGADGSVYVYDTAYGFQQYKDISPVPEPSFWAMALLGFGAVGAALRRRAGQARSVA